MARPWCYWRALHPLSTEGKLKHVQGVLGSLLIKLNVEVALYRRNSYLHEWPVLEVVCVSAITAGISYLVWNLSSSIPSSADMLPSGCFFQVGRNRAGLRLSSITFLQSAVVRTCGKSLPRMRPNQGRLSWLVQVGTVHSARLNLSLNS